MADEMTYMPGGPKPRHRNLDPVTPWVCETCKKTVPLGETAINPATLEINCEECDAKRQP